MVVDKQYPSIILCPSPQTLYCPAQVGGFCGYWMGERRKEGGCLVLPPSPSFPPSHAPLSAWDWRTHGQSVTVEKHDWVQVWAFYRGQCRDCPVSERAGRPNGFLRALCTALPGRAYRLHSLHICRLHLSHRQRGNHREYSACAGTWTGPGYRCCSVWRDQVRTLELSVLLGILFNSSN